MARAKSSKPIRVADVLAAALPGLGERMLEDGIRRGWAGVVGADIARRSRPRELRLGILTVIVDNSPWLHELTLRSGELLAAVRARYGGSVTSLRLSLGERSPATPPIRRPRTVPAARLSVEEQHSVATIAASVADPALADTVRRLVTKDLVARRRRGTPSPDEERTHE